MLPTLDNSGEMVIKSPSLITLTSPINPSRIICKRVIGLPGDVVCVDPTGLKAPSTEHVVIPKGHVWVAGDNTAWSTDSRDYGRRIAARIYPLNRLTVFSNNATYIG
ncbi:signal peptidase I family protein [Suillus lakei]|nr:signal peptidase I family protein [Suillus lakei]